MKRNRLRWLQRTLLRFHFLAINRPSLVLAITLLVFIGCAIGLSNTRIVLTVDDMTDEDFPSLAHLQTVKERFHPGHAVVFTFYNEADQHLTESELCKINEWIELEKNNNPEIQLVMSGFDPVRSVHNDGTLVYDPLLNINCKSQSAKSPLAAFRATPWENIVSSLKQSTFNVSVQFRDTQTPTPFGVFNPAPIRELEQRTKDFFSDSKLSFHLVGTGAFRLFLAEAMLGDQWLNILFAGVLWLMFRAFLGSWKGGLIIFINIGLVALTLLGLMGLFSVPLDMISNSLIIIVMIAAIQDFLFVSFHQRKRGCDFKKSFRIFMLPGFFTSLTTVIGFGSLMLSKFSPIQTFGLWAAIGAIIEWLVTFVVLPALLCKFSYFRSWTLKHNSYMNDLTSKLNNVRLPRPIFVLAIMLFTASIPTVFLINPADEPNDYLEENHPFNRGVNLLKERHGWDARIYLAFKNMDKEKRHRQTLADVSQWPNVATIEDPYAVKDFVLADNSESIKDIIRSEFKGAPVYNHYFSDDNWTLARLYLKETSTQIIDKMIFKIAKLCPSGNCFLADTLVSFTEISHQLIHTMLTSFIMSLLMVSLVILILAKLSAMKITRVLAILFSSFWGIGIIFLLLYLSGLKINYVTVIFAAVLVGIAGDNAIHYILAGRHHKLEYGVKNRGEGSIQIYVTCALTCLVFLFSTLNSPRVLGLLFFLGFIASLFGDLWILKGFIREKSLDQTRIDAATKKS